jgi:hypothetical protein
VSKFLDLTGQTFGFLYVLKRAENSKQGNTRFKCLCIRDGNQCDVSRGHLTTGHTKSCGCLRREITAASSRGRFIHGQTRVGRYSPEYMAWIDARRRTTKRNYHGWPNYGGRGIRFHEPWLNDLPAFFAHVGPRPSGKHSLGRIDNNGHYEAGNVEWQLPREQLNNTRRNRLITIDGLTLTAIQWEREAGIDADARGQCQSGQRSKTSLGPLGLPPCSRGGQNAGETHSRHCGAVFGPPHLFSG